MNGHTYLRNYRLMVLLSYATFFGAVYLYTVPEDYKTEE
jgi:hypothetical protein